MENETRKHSLRLIRLFVDFFQYNLSENEHNELDEWVCKTDDNLLVFESVVEIAAGLMILEDFSHLQKKNMQRFKDIFKLMEKQVEKTITDEEKEILIEWANNSEHNRTVFKAIAMF